MLCLPSARGVWRRAREAGCEKVLVGLSGKDSLAVADLAIREFGAGSVECFFMFLVKGLQCVEQPLDRFCAQRKIPLHKVPHFELGRMFQYAILMPRRRKGILPAFRQMKMTDIEQLVRERTGIEWLAYGHLMNDSLERRGMLSSIKGCNTAQHRAYPLWEWSTRAVRAYLHQRGIPLPTMIGAGKMKRSSGVDLRPTTLRFIRDNYPDDFTRLCVTFPLAPAAAMRADLMEQDEQEAIAAV